MAESAARSDFTPIGIDLFGDEDLRAVCKSCRVVSKSDYPRGFIKAAREFDGLPRAYGGGLENYPDVVAALAAGGPLWGNDSATIARCRAWDAWNSLAPIHGIQWPERHQAVLNLERGRKTEDWLVKPIRGAAGNGIRSWEGEPIAADEFVERRREGTLRSAVFVASDGGAILFYFTRQLVGEPWCRASRYSYCGSICGVGSEIERFRLVERMGKELARAFVLRGVFGIDYFELDGAIAPIELNPRWTASIEVLERIFGFNVFFSHALSGGCPRPPFLDRCVAADRSEYVDAMTDLRCRAVGKAILFAKEGVITPPLERRSFNGCELADIPASGTSIAKGEPIVSVLVEELDVDDATITEKLKNAVEAVEWRIYAS
ncbi:MAG TPA: ATP-grasp domain-containing protein [Planctomycetia bacterium]|nr:ATP-grasp domain-containing protein [Planctomycetia bacterium]